MQTAKEIMTAEVVTIQPSASVAQAMDLMRENKLRDLIVEPAGEEAAYGIVTEADIVYKVAANGADPKAISVGEVMTMPCIEVEPDLTVEEVARLFANHHIHRAPVVKGKLLGIVTTFDIVRETMWWQG